MSERTQFEYDVFLSHSSKDKPLVRPLAERLRADGLRVWFDEWVLKIGDSIPAKVEEGLENSRLLVLCMSANAFGSDWAALESQTFRFRDPLNRERRFLPVRLDDAPLKGSLAQFLYVDWREGERRDGQYATLLEVGRAVVHRSEGTSLHPPPKGDTNEPCMTAQPPAHPKVFISYSHDSPEHRDRVLGLSERLRADGFEAAVDRYVEGTPPQGWPRWMLNQIDWADYILLVCTETYYRRFRGHEAPGIGKGVDWEGALITNELYDQKSVSTRFVPILFDASQAAFIPEPLCGAAHYLLTSDEAYRSLTAYLANAAGVVPAPLGPLPHLKRRTGTPIEFSTGGPLPDPHHSASASRPDLSNVPAPGGAMSAGDESYVERRSDRSARDAAGRQRCETLVIRGPSQFGKSSLLTHYLARCRAAGKQVASVHFSGFEESIVSHYGRFLTSLATQLARRLRRQPPVGELGTQHAFVGFIETSLLATCSGPLVFAFDETDRIMRQDYAQDFFSMVRMWHNDRADPESAWQKVGLALASSSEPQLFIRDALRSPFNVGLRLSVDLFSLEEAERLNANYGSPLSTAQCARLHRLLGGHPFLTQDAYYKLYGPDPLPFEMLESQASQDDGPFGEHLRAMLSNLQKTDGLLAALKQVISYGTVPRRDDYYRLEGAGLVQRLYGRIAPTNQIYLDFFRHA